jgi:hypothetical protein
MATMFESPLKLNDMFLIFEVGLPQLVQNLHLFQPSAIPTEMGMSGWEIVRMSS